MVYYARNVLFKYRWAGQTVSLQELISTIKKESLWDETAAYRNLISSLRPLIAGASEVERDLRGAPLSGVDLSKAPLAKTDLLKADLSFARLKGADLSEGNLWGADLTKANLRESNLSRANLWEANLSKADLGQADLSGANLSEADMTGVDLWKARLAGAILRGANLSGANLKEVDLSEADLGDAMYTTDQVFNRFVHWWLPNLFRRIPLVNRLTKIKAWTPVGVTNFSGINTGKMNGSKNPVLKRHIEDYQFIEAFKRKNWFHRWVLYPLWKISSDCGRSLTLWFIWSVVLIGFLSFVSPQYWPSGFDQPNFKWLGMRYSDLMSPSPQLRVIIEIVVGYLMLGGLISILVNKLARRA